MISKTALARCTRQVNRQMCFSAFRLSQRPTMELAAKIGISRATLYRYHKEYRGWQVFPFVATYLKHLLES